jgi:tetratricopeptide (TPR) repeat protein
MNKNHFLTSLLLLVSLTTFAQFHTLNIPQLSPRVKETQKVGITFITVDYSSPALRGRDVWNDTNILPHNGDPVAWRVGANLNTTISFSTDVTIEGQQLKAGKYGFHIIPRDEVYTLLFAHNNQQWGSYYLDMENDISLTVDVKSVTCPTSEQMEFEFLNREENALVVGLEWGDKRIPFTVAVDLNKTVVESFRSELRGVNIYRWQAWDDAANWCLRHDTNLEEALAWANQSINGGYGGFAANKNMTNLTTKLRLLKKLNRNEEMASTIKEAKKTTFTAFEANRFSLFMMENEYHDEALNYLDHALIKYPNSWFLVLNKGIAYFFLKDKKKAIKQINLAITTCPEQYRNRLNEIIKEIETDTYKIPTRG